MMVHEQLIGINVETLLLVAVWEHPFIFQGCFKITELEGKRAILFFFRCQAQHEQQSDILEHDFSCELYEFSHLYHEAGAVPLINLDPEQEDALYLLKYALHITLREMLTNRKVHFTSIDDVAMLALIEQVRPILNKQVPLADEEYLGFAVAMDFHPHDKTTLAAALTLLVGNTRF